MTGKRKPCLYWSDKHAGWQAPWPPSYWVRDSFSLSASAGEQGRRNTTIGLGALSLYFLSRGDTLPGLIGAAGTAYACKRYDDSVKSRKNRQKVAYRKSQKKRYSNTYRSSYRVANTRQARR
ncbi:MAG: hypothetical protein IT210_14845 [Armatimonadetes bacterium]|nr:hypothetical protein [Armatimonadota bacterium]